MAWASSATVYIYIYTFPEKIWMCWLICRLPVVYGVRTWGYHSIDICNIAINIFRISTFFLILGFLLSFHVLFQVSCSYNSMVKSWNTQQYQQETPHLTPWHKHDHFSLNYYRLYFSFKMETTTRILSEIEGGGGRGPRLVV